MVNALKSSDETGCKTFQVGKDGVVFGWKTIRELFERELERARGGKMRRVKGLQRSFITRDAWTKMDVHAAKIIQSENVIAELKEHKATLPPATLQFRATEDTIQYLTALHGIFEEGFLCHEKIESTESVVLKRIQHGLLFFSEWYEKLWSTTDFCPSSPREKRFLGWQTFDLLRLSLYGFQTLCDNYFSATNNKNHYIIPFRVNGSAIETVFGQVRQKTHGKVTSLSYPPALKKLQIEGNLKPFKKRCTEEYRNTELFLS